MKRSFKRPTIALLPWGDVFEEFLDTINVSLDEFCDELTGGWLFGYIEALQLNGIDAVVVIFSARVFVPTCRTHLPTGATIYILPSPKRYRILSSFVTKVSAALAQSQQGPRLSGLLTYLLGSIETIASYASTPIIHLVSALHEMDCDVLLCQEYEYSRFDVCVLIGLFTKIPVFATFQGGVGDQNIVGRLVRAGIVRASAGLIIGPQKELERVLSALWVPERKTVRIFNPIDLRLWQPLDRTLMRTQLNIPLTSQVVVWHGRISIYHKGLDILLDAWEHVCYRYRGGELRLLIIGTGQDAQEFKGLLEARKLPNIQWINQYTRDRTKIQEYLSAGDVFAFASRYEGFAVAPLEAMACGLPVVATCVEGIPDIFEGMELSGGLVGSTSDAEQLASMLLRVLTDATLKQELGKNARRRVESAFSIEAIGHQLRDFLLGNGGQP